MSDRICVICSKPNPHMHQDFCVDLGCSGRLTSKKEKPKPKLIWEDIDNTYDIWRAKVFGGWLVRETSNVMTSLHPEQSAQEGYEWRTSICFVPDPNHEWEL